MLYDDPLMARALVNVYHSQADVGRRRGLQRDPGSTSASAWDLLCSWSTQSLSVSPPNWKKREEAS